MREVLSARPNRSERTVTGRLAGVLLKAVLLDFHRPQAVIRRIVARALRLDLMLLVNAIARPTRLFTVIRWNTSPWGSVSPSVADRNSR
jgi:hypothetical protein